MENVLFRKNMVQEVPQAVEASEAQKIEDVDFQ